MPNSVKAWGGAGHQLIAAEAYRQLSAQTKAQVIEVLKAHPDYNKWAQAYRPNANFDQFAYIFMRCSTWPDEIRRTGNQYDHPDWHFIDYPLRPPNFTFEQDARPNDDVLFGIAEAEKTLSDPNAAPELRGVMMSYLVHLIGDEHQPLHCESYFTSDYPNGDKGGNDFYVRPGQRVVGLHSIWDGLLGTAINPRMQWNYAIKLQTKFPPNSLPELTEHATPKAWSLESRELAIDVGYLRGDLKGGVSRDDAPSLPPDYLKNAKACAERQGALAGYRLAAEIEEYLKVAAPVPLLPENTFVASKAEGPIKIGTADASKYYDESEVVTGKVEKITIGEEVNFINLDGVGRSAPFTAIIFPDNADKFGDLNRFQNQQVEISGTVTEYHNKPEIILETPDQIKVVPGM